MSVPDVAVGFFAGGFKMDWSKWVRQLHRWLAITFVAAVVVNIGVQGQQEIALWVGLLTLVPLALLILTGLYMFVLPYAARWRSG
jgi:hypothetical protein